MIKNIIFDFDGVILDSIPVKTEAFKKLFEKFPFDKVDVFIEYHLENGGVSRFMKIKYFFEEILLKTISEEEIKNYAEKYSELTKKELANSKYLINDTLNFIKENYQKYEMHIASGADENDLNYICDKLNLRNYFLTINGSPTVKSKIVENILKNYNYKKEETILIGDSINDYQSAEKNGIRFFGYNNLNLVSLGNYIKTFKKIVF